MTSAVYLGFDASTQGLAAVAVAIDGPRRHVVFEHAIRYDEALPAYGTVNGVRRETDSRVVTAPPCMWAEALETMMAIIARDSGIVPGQVRALSGAAQQHGSVYVRAAASSALQHLDPSQPLVEQVRGLLSRAQAPVWLDTSTGDQCAAITAAMGGEEQLIRLTGSRAFERFTAPQIRRFYEEDPEAYHRTGRIHLVSSFHASLLVGGHAPIEPGDGAGMNLMDIERRAWAPAALEATAPALAQKLPPLVPSPTIVGRLAPYWVERYGLSSTTKVAAWTGDNPSSSIGVGLVDPSTMAISLGTSDTVFGLLRTPRVDRTGASHVFGSPTGDYLALVCFANGSLARERVRDAYGLSWSGFSQALRETRPGNRGRIMLPWFDAEITPRGAGGGVRRYGLDPADGPANIRAIVEAQMMAQSIHTSWMGHPAHSIHATGGAVRNREILQIMADVHDADVYPMTGGSAALGAALRAYHADQLDTDAPLPWPDILEGFAVRDVANRIRPDRRHAAIYAELTSAYAACEAHALGCGPSPAPLIASLSFVD